METPPVIVWFRNDLRLSDNPALAAAARTGAPVAPLFVLDDAAAGRWARGGASRWWLHHSLDALAGGLEKVGLRLILRRGDAGAVVRSLAAETGARAVYWNRRYAPWATAQDTAVKAMLRDGGVAGESFNAGLLHEPWTVRTQAGGPYKVFTPFWRRCRALPPPPTPEPAPRKIAPPAAWPDSDRLADWRLLPGAPDWAGGLRAAWTPGEAGAQARLRRFLDRGLETYAADRDRPGRDGTSGLSPHLHFGEIGPRQVWHAAATRAQGGGDKFLSEIGWREFAHHLLFHFPQMPESPLREAFAAFPWRDDRAALRAWQQGRTGIPIVDAGMRQLWRTGWMHNRVRMIVASFLTKNLLLPWQAGAEWFWDTLVDADLANNSAGWQWVAGCGADAAPYFRIFNPVAQGEKFDPEGAYVRQWVPEISGIPGLEIHRPWTAAGGTAGPDYPAPIVDLAASRQRALEAYAASKTA